MKKNASSSASVKPTDRASLAMEALQAKDHLSVSRILFPNVTKQEIHYLIAHALRTEKLSIADSVAIMQDVNPRHFQLALKHIEESYERSNPQTQELAYLIRKKAIDDAESAFAHVIEMKMKNHRLALALVSTMGSANWQHYLNKMKEHGVNAHDASAILNLRTPDLQAGLDQFLLENLSKVSTKVKYSQFPLGIDIQSTLSGLNALGAIARSWPSVRKYKDDLGFGALVKQSKSPNYKNVLDLKFEIEAARAGLDYRKFPLVQDIYLLSKDTPGPLPTLDCSWFLSENGKEIVLRSWQSTAGKKPVVGSFVDKSNYKNLFYGEYTNCSQKLQGQFQTLLHYFQQSPEATFFVVTLKDNPNGIISQSPVIKRGNTLVIEGIESAGHSEYMQAVEQIYEEAAESLVQYHFERVELATTSQMKFLGIDFEQWPHSNVAKEKYPKGYKGPSDYWTIETLPEFGVRVLASNKNYVKARAKLDHPNAVTEQLFTPSTYLSIAEEADLQGLLKLAKSIYGKKFVQFIFVDSSMVLKTLNGEIIGYANMDSSSRTVLEILFKKGTKDIDAEKLLIAVFNRMKLIGGDWKITDQNGEFERISELMSNQENTNGNLSIEILNQSTAADIQSKPKTEQNQKRSWWNISTVFKRIVD